MIMIIGTFLILTSWLVRGLPLWLSIIDTIIGFINWCFSFCVLKRILKSTNFNNIEGEHNNND